MSDTTRGPQDAPLEAHVPPAEGPPVAPEAASDEPALGTPTPLEHGPPSPPPNEAPTPEPAAAGEPAPPTSPSYYGLQDFWPAAGTLPPAGPSQPVSPRDRKPRRGRWYALVGLLAGALGAALTTGAFLLWFDRGQTTEVIRQVETRIIGIGGEVPAAEVARAVLPSIVTVEVSAGAVDLAADFAADGSGSGVVLTSDGLLVTNEHVVSGAAAVRVIFAGGRAYPAEVVGQDAVTDLAVLRIAADNLTPIALGSSQDLEIGDTAIAVGSPLGLEGGPSVTVGVISAFDRQLRTGVNEYLFGLIQTDAPITRGSSGGALVDARGRLIGITAAIGISDVGAEGLGFAIPVELMQVITEQLIARGAADHPFLGIEGATYFRQEADGSSVPAGVYVSRILADTAAVEAGVREGDVIQSVGGEPLATMEQLVVVLRFYRVGDVVDLQIDRGGTLQTIPVTLMERPEGT